MDKFVTQSTCNKSADLFCFVCSSFITSRKKIYSLTPAFREVFISCYQKDVTQFGADLCYSSSKVCTSCVNDLNQHVKFNKPLKYSSPATWKKLNRTFKTHEESCYVCLAEIIQGTRFHSYASWPFNCRHNVIPAVLNLINEFEPSCSAPKISRRDSTESEIEINSHDDPNFSSDSPDETDTPRLYDQAALNDLVRDLGLSKEQSLLLASNLWKRKLLHKDCRISYYEKRNHEIVKFFDEHNGMPYLKDIDGLFAWFGVEYDLSEWRLFIDSSKSALKCVLLHNGNKYPSIPLLYSPSLKETYSDVELALKIINYAQNKWRVIADFKLLNLLCGIGCASVANPCIFCEWKGTYRSNNKYLQYHQKFEQRSTFNIGVASVVAKPLINIEDVLLPPLHIKIGLVAQFVKALSSDSAAYDFIKKKLAYKSEGKLAAGQLNGPEIRKLLRLSNELQELLNAKEKRAWIAFDNICKNFLGKYRVSNYKDLAKELCDSYEDMGCNMSYKLHVVAEHIDAFPENCSDFSDEMGERFHQDIKNAEKKYQGRYNKYMLADYCWLLKCETLQSSRQNSRKQSFPISANL